MFFSFSVTSISKINQFLSRHHPLLLDLYSSQSTSILNIQSRDSISSSTVIDDQNHWIGKNFFEQGIDVKSIGQFFFTRCVFDSCSSFALGGAIFISGSDLSKSQLSIANCYFEHCSSSMNGGAIYSLTSRFNISYVCITESYSKINLAFNLHAESIDIKKCSPIDYMSIIGCQKTRSSYTASLTSTSSFLSSLNMTDNSVDDHSSGIQITSYGFVGMHNSQFSRNSGSSCLIFRFQSNYTSLYRCNLFNNTASLSWDSLITVQIRGFQEKIPFGNFVFFLNHNPLLNNNGISYIYFWNCTFDEALSSELFKGSHTMSLCHFNILNPESNHIFLPQSQICHNPFKIQVKTKTNTNSLSYFVIIPIISILFIFYFSLRKRQTFGRNRFPYHSRKRFIL